VPTDTVREIIRAQEFMGGVRPVADVMETEDGRELSFPFNDATGETAEQIDENPSADTSLLNTSFSEKKLNSFTYSSKEMRVSRQLLQDNVFDLVAEFRRIASRRFFNRLNPLFTTGSGSGEPEGLVTASAVTANAQGSNSLVREDLINFIHKVDRAYRNNGAFQFTDEVVSSIRKLEFGSSDSRPLYQPSARSGEPDRIEGYPFFVNNDLDSLGSGNKVATFGDHSQFRIRDVQDAEMMRLDELRALRNQVSFVMFMRHDSKLLDPNAVGVLQML
jgi:HK97 family phage major capsid protein